MSARTALQQAPPATAPIITKNECVAIIVDIVKAPDTSAEDKIRGIELLARLLGWNAPIKSHVLWSIRDLEKLLSGGQVKLGG